MSRVSISNFCKQNILGKPKLSLDQYPIKGILGMDCASAGSNIIVDDDATIGEGVDSNHYVYANNYKHSELREYLTGTFYNTAFNENEKSSIVLTERLRQRD